MRIVRAESDQLKALEESLWRRETRFDYEYMDRVLADGFFEFGRSGRVYDRDMTLGAAPQDFHAELPLQGFKVQPIGADAVLVTYVSVVTHDEVEVANRSSIWIRTGLGWRLRFHQGTPTTFETIA